MYHIGLIVTVQKVLNCVCYHCSRLRLDEVPPLTRELLIALLCICKS